MYKYVSKIQKNKKKSKLNQKLKTRYQHTLHTQKVTKYKKMQIHF